MPTPQLSAFAIPGIPLIEADSDLGKTLAKSVDDFGLRPADGDIFVIAQKIVSKAENRLVQLADIQASPEAIKLAGETEKDPRIVQLILRESRQVVRHRPGVIIVEHRLGLILANAGIDRSNVSPDSDTVLLLPEDPDRSARQLKNYFDSHYGAALGVLITDSIGRPWRLGTTGVAIGCAGMPVLEDLRGHPDLFGRSMEVSEVATADSIAATAALLMGEGSEGIPLVVIRGRARTGDGQTATALLRPKTEDLFRP
jgi:coenzyme F420-0:L-glutamate ligase/coenzyme F420-1:gamma-L-glutamate ligase